MSTTKVDPYAKCHEADKFPLHDMKYALFCMRRTVAYLIPALTAREGPLNPSGTIEAEPKNLGDGARMIRVELKKIEKLCDRLERESANARGE